MNILRLNKILTKFYDKKIVLDKKEINSFIMDRDYFLDVFETRYEISIEMNRPIKGLKETLDLFRESCSDKICSTSIKNSTIDIILYTDPFFDEVYGIVEFAV